jgi:hypothetical protein
MADRHRFSDQIQAPALDVQTQLACAAYEENPELILTPEHKLPHN